MSYPGRCVDEQVGVNAPGSANSTTFFPVKISSDVRSFQSNGFGPSIDSSLTLVLKVTSGTSIRF